MERPCVITVILNRMWNKNIGHLEKVDYLKNLKIVSRNISTYNMSSKIISLQYSWLQKLCDENFHEWKIIPSHLISKYFGRSFKFLLRLSFNHKILIKFPEIYKNVLFQWSSSLFAFSELSSCIMSNSLWFNKHILIEKSPSFFVIFLTKA